MVESGEDAMAAPLKSLKWYRSLADKKGRLEAGFFLIEGDKAISQIIAGHPDATAEILSVDEPPPLFRRYPARTLTASQFRYISAAQTPQGIAAVVRIPVDISSASLPVNAGSRVLLLEDIQDPGNVGTLIRSAAAFDYAGVILTENCADPLSPKCVQSTAGAILSVWLRRTAQYLELVRSLRQDGYTLIAADLKGSDKPSVLSKQEKLVLALGNETAGLSEGLLSIADYRVRLPIVPEKAESLNVAVCGAIMMYLSSEK
jgi:TrmH family RNA methyltransferase